MIDFEALLAETAGDPPCGPDLEYDGEFLDLERAAQGKPEQQFGDTVIPAEEPDWNDVRERAERLFARSKDVRVAVLLARALTRIDGVPGFVAGIRLLTELLDRHWQGVHPRLDADDNDDPTMRLNALAPLTDPTLMLRDLRAAWIVRSRSHGQALVRDAEIALGRMNPRADETPPSLAEIQGIVRGVAAEAPDQLAAARAALAAVKALAAFLDDRVGSGSGPDLTPLRGVAYCIDQVVAEAAGAMVPAESAPSAVPGVPVGAVAVPAGEIASRADALRLLDKVCDFMQRTEPSNPAPLLIRRAQRLIGMGFFEIIADLAPDSLSQIEHIAGARHEGG